MYAAHCLVQAALASGNILVYDSHHSRVAHTSNSFFVFNLEYAYSVNVSGSTGFLFSCHRFSTTLSQTVHWFHTWLQLNVTSTQSDGSG